MDSLSEPHVMSPLEPAMERNWPHRFSSAQLWPEQYVIRDCVPSKWWQNGSLIPFYLGWLGQNNVIGRLKIYKTYKEPIFTIVHIKQMLYSYPMVVIQLNTVWCLRRYFRIPKYLQAIFKAPKRLCFFGLLEPEFRMQRSSSWARTLLTQAWFLRLSELTTNCGRQRCPNLQV